MTIKVAVVGATGKMGKLALEIIEAAQDLTLHAALDSKSELSQALGANVIFEVTRLDVSEQVVDFAVANNINILVGTSGWSANRLARVNRLIEGSTVGVVVIPNFSIGSMLASSFAAQAARFFDSIEIVETHHTGKFDSPSGTAVRTAEMIHEARASLTQPLIVGVGQTARGEVVAGVPVHSLRMVGIAAKQDVILSAESEVLTISHQTNDISAYSFGVLLSLRFTAHATGLTVGLQAVTDASAPKA